MSVPPHSHTTANNPWELFGLDLRTIGQDWLHAMRQLHRLPPLRWFELNPSVQLIRADHSTALWRNARLRAQQEASTADANPPVFAVELPEALLLRRSLHLPELPEAQLRDAVLLDVLSSSPFAQDDIAWGFIQTRTDTGWRTDAAFASRAQIAQHLAGLPQDWPSAQSEVWAFAPQSLQPIVLQGYAEGLREGARARRRTQTWLALGTCALLLGALALTPTLQLRRQALQADAAYNQLIAQTARLAEERAALTTALENIHQIRQRQSMRVNLAQVLQFLSELLPADVFLHTLEFENQPAAQAGNSDTGATEGDGALVQKLVLMGEADNAAAVIQLLGAQDAFTDVRTTQPVQQVPNANKERFTVQMAIAPGAFNVHYSTEDLPEPQAQQPAQLPQAPAPEAPQPPATAQPAEAAPPAATAAPTPAPQAPVPQAPAPQPPAAPPTTAQPVSRVPANSGATPMTPPQLAPSALPVSSGLAGQAPDPAPAPAPEAAPAPDEASHAMPDEGEPNEEAGEP